LESFNLPFLLLLFWFSQNKITEFWLCFGGSRSGPSCCIAQNNKKKKEKKLRKKRRDGEIQGRNEKEEEERYWYICKNKEEI